MSASTLPSLTGSPVLVLGAGKSGIAAARLAASRGAAVTILDTAPAERLERAGAQLSGTGIRLVPGFTGGKWMGAAVSLVIVSPGIALDSPLAEAGKSTGAPLLGELEFAAQLAPWPLYAVTGTNGKTTATELLTACLKESGRRVEAAGNIGLPLSQLVLDAPALDAAVIEVSSFQMEHAEGLHPELAIVLNITPDHLDRHGSMETYRALKLQLLRQILPGGHAVYHAALESWLEPLPQGVSRSRLWLAGETPELINRPAAQDWQVTAEGLGPIMPPGLAVTTVKRSGLNLAGNHNLANVAAVAAAMTALGVPLDQYQQALSQFRAGAHRLQELAEVRGVRYFDDSKATDVDALKQALRTIGPGIGRRVHLIAGGLDKGCSLAEVKTELRMYVKTAYLIGECRERLGQEWGKDVPCQICGSMAEAVQRAAAAAAPGETVLLSPACASMDMFKDYAERGDRFGEAVRALPQ